MLSNQIKRIREQKGYSQERLAELSGLSLRTVQRVENGKSEPRGDTINRLCNALEIPPEKVMDWNKREDKAYLNVTNLSALSFIFFPLLGIILPLIFWITKRDQIRKLNQIGKDLLNFQIAWSVLLTISLLAFSIWYANYTLNIRIVSVENIYGPLQYTQWGFAVAYGYNILIILINAILISRDKPVWYYPRINFIC